MLLYDGWHKIEEIIANIKGREVKREKIIIKGGVSGIVINRDNKVLLVKQYRPCVGHYTYELVAGCIDKDISNKEILLEELQEECEITKDEVISISEKPLVEYYMMCGSSDATMSIYLVKVDSKSINKKVDDVDVEEIVWVTVQEMEEMKEKGLIKDGKTIIALEKLKNYFKNDY
ncbi:NUDIX hydrolase [Tepidibacter thalassicus]|nr:NUDIX hydrolase [Tepidibacter thalassicus]